MKRHEPIPEKREQAVRAVSGCLVVEWKAVSKIDSNSGERKPQRHNGTKSTTVLKKAGMP